MTTAQSPAAQGILNALSLAGKTQQDAADALGVSVRTWKRRIASDTLTLQDLRRLSDLTGIRPGAMLSASFLGTAAA